MAMFNYESDALYQQVKGEALPSTPVYVAECKKEMIDEVSPNYPQLVEYEKEWLNFAQHVYHEGTPVPLEYEEVDTYGQATVQNTIPFYYKSAILKGQTLVNIFKSFANYTYSASEMGIKWLIVGSAPLTETLNNDELTMTITGVGSKVVRIDDVSMLKPNTKYMVKINYTASFENEISFGWIDNSAIYNQVASMKSNENVIFTTPSDLSTLVGLWFGILGALQIGDVMKISKPVLIEYQEGMENWDIPYFEGMQSVKMPVLTTTGKNLFNINDNFEMGYINEKGEISLSDRSDSFERKNNGFSVNITSEFGGIVSNYIEVNQNTEYLFIFNQIGNYPTQANITFFNKDKEAIGGLDDNRLTESFTTPPSCSYLRVGFWLFDTPRTICYEDIQLQKTPVESSYEPYKSNILTTPEDLELRGIGDVKDELNCLTGEVTERIGEVILDGSESWNIHSYSSDDFLLIYTDIANKSTNNLLCDKLPTWNGTAESLRNQTQSYIWANPNKSIFVWIEKSKLSEATTKGFKDYLQSNPIILQYRIANESIKTVDLNTPIKPYEGTNHYTVSSDTIPPQLLLSLPVVSTGAKTLNDIITEE